MPVIGNGDIAKVLKDRKGWTFFASGVSDSSETRKSEFDRELNLLLDQNKNNKLIYFSSLCVFYSDTPYAQHKKKMESVIKTNFDRWTIIRLGNITWGTNPKTLINFFKNRIKNGEHIEIQDTYRYITDKDEFLYWMDMIPDWNCEMNIVGRRLKVKDIVNEIKRGIGKTV